ncbi:MAG TPA: 23S rRNA (pseudouridine(1915)-N(3))-methyltransferase RlmH [Nevskiaceae bacterium]|nr:23S rRNA (pseudouridine(1915)-N(3))-methyltransferase RlmH [Nevskiaceae bacterium]
MHLRLIAVGTRMPEWVTAGVEDYLRRLPRELKAAFIEVPLAARSAHQPVAKLKAEEGAKILKVAAGARLIALDEHGRQSTTLQWAQALRGWMRDGRDVAFAIGGPDGHDAALLSAAEDRWALSRLTLPHALVRVVLAEQLYRAWTVTANHPYHRA